MTVRQYVYGLWALDLTDLEFRRNPGAVLDREPPSFFQALYADLSAKDALTRWVVDAMTEIAEAGEILKRYDWYLQGDESRRMEVPLEVAIASEGVATALRLLDMRLRDVIIWLGMHTVAMSIQHQLSGG